MNTVAVLTPDRRIQKLAADAVAEVSDDYEIIIVDTWERVLRHLNYEFPEVNIVYIDSKKLPGGGILDEMRNDPWLHFGGLMSFLLHNKRSATVTSVGYGMLLKIDKDQFVQTVRDHPHYGILLARILANRLVALHHAPT